MRVLLDPSAHLRMVFVLIGSGLALALALLDVTVIATLTVSDTLPLWTIIAIGVLLAVRFPHGTPTPALDWTQRCRSLGWFVTHLLAGAVPVALVPLAIQLREAVWVAVCLVVAMVALFALG